MTHTSKTGSSRRKGDQFQDLTALELALDSYIANEPFELFIEYERAGSLDDILRVFPQAIDAYQAKHAVNDGSVYVPDDFTNADSKVFIKKFADSWKTLTLQFPHHRLRLHLRSNRSLDATLAEVVTKDGYFDDKFRENRYKKEKRILRKSIFDASGLTDSEFQQFLLVFHFDLKRPSYLRLEELIKAELLDHKLGISDRSVFAELKRLVEHHAIETSDPITPAMLDKFIRKTQTRYLLPQSFAVDTALFVEQETFVDALDDLLARSSGQYAVVTGLPGSGKSTALTAYCDTVDEDTTSPYIFVRYYCFVSLQDNFQHRRLEAQSLRTNILTELQRRFPSVLNSRKFDFGADQFVHALDLLSAN